MIGAPGADASANILASASRPVRGTIPTVVSLITLVILSMGIFSELQDAFDLIWRMTPQKGTALWGIIKRRFLPFMLVIGTGLLLLGSLILSAVLAALSTFILQAVPGPQVILIFVDMAVSLPEITLLFALMFKVFPDGYIAWIDVWFGGR